MAGDVAIRVEGLGKSYIIGHEARRERYVSLRDVMARAAHGAWRRTVDMARGRAIVAGDSTEEFWALKDVNFEVNRGEVLGIIGRNGAGKSTLLKILSRITEPSEGRVTIKGRVASLLEVGTGFHPELTGRENVYLNGALLGMSGAEVRRKFDEIVAFAEIEKFIDTPVKRYSSGMYLRLAFAVAAHLEPEILIVDEVLAVGDAVFQKKCLGKLQDVTDGGRTVLFVSHDTHAVASLCDNGILLNDGKIEFSGLISSVVAHYLQGKSVPKNFANLTNCDRSGSGNARFRSIEMLKRNVPTEIFAMEDSLTLRISIDVNESFGTALFAVLILSSDGTPVHELWNVNENCYWDAKVGSFVFEVTIPELRLYPGLYAVDLWLGDRNSMRVDYVRNAVAFQVMQASTLPSRRLDQSNGIVFQQSLWTMAQS